MKFYYDLHIHSCLSPCADDSMTPASIAGMAKLGGLDICALTDHNSVKNCPAFSCACDFYGVIPLFGMELTTSEDVHMICLFSSLDTASEFGSFVDTVKIGYRNKPDIFGRQLIMDEDDNVIGEEENLLINAAAVGIDEAYRRVVSLGGACYPAHIDREANGIISVLGAFPEDSGFTSYELNSENDFDFYVRKYPHIANLRRVVCSDAHYIPDINDRMHYVELDCEKSGAADAVIAYLRGE